MARQLSHSRCWYSYNNLNLVVDITPHTEGSRVVMMLLIVISLAVLPSLLADVLNTLRKRNGNALLTIMCILDDTLTLFRDIRLGRICIRIFDAFHLVGRIIQTRASNRDPGWLFEYSKSCRMHHHVKCRS